MSETKQKKPENPYVNPTMCTKFQYMRSNAENLPYLQATSNGISLLDHYAGLAMQASIMNDHIFQDTSGEQMAKGSYDYAQFMLIERQKRINKESL